MRRFYKIARNAPSSPVRLIVSCVLAFVVMVFINGFIGSMGGLPSLIAFVIVFYLLRSVMSAENRITRQLAMTSRRELFYVFADYCVAYLGLWTLLRLGLMFSRVTGWGNINGASALEYVKDLLATPMLEKWAYFFVGVLMFAFILSLFPLVVIRRPSAWAAYAVLDGAAFALICEILGVVSRMEIGEKLFTRGACVIDYLLLCGGFSIRTRILCMIGILVFTAIVGCFSFFFADYCYGPKPGRMDVDTSAWMPGEMKRFSGDISQLRRNLILSGIGVLLFCGIMAVVLFGPKEETAMYEKVAEYLTGDSALGPMIYEGQIFIPVDENLTLYESGIPQGYLGRKGEACDTRLYELTVANVLYAGENRDKLQVYGANVGSFAAAKTVEEKDAWREDALFLLWDEDWVSESAYSHEPTGYTTCSAKFVESLEARFGEVVYRSKDFADYDAYFSLYGYADMEHAVTEELKPGHWVGCILVKDNVFYYGNYENRITGVLLQELLDILGGY